ncbi:MAG TPA: outer membrane beta-barrel protein [Draconibacterium sp.]|nr:outer membrane beta-barrel protein [Draconibacterium sp.]
MTIRYRFLMILLLSTLTGSLCAQTFGIKAGYTLSDLLVKDGDENLSYDFSMVSGFHMGPTLEIGLFDGFSLETALLFTTKGVKVNTIEFTEGVSLSSKSKVNTIYLDVPLYMRVYRDVGKTEIYALAGTFLGWGLTGKSKMDPGSGGDLYSLENDITWGADDDDDFKRLEVGLGVGGGMVLNSFIIEYSAHFGLNNIAPGTDANTTLKNRAFMFSVGYKFR